MLSSQKINQLFQKYSEEDDFWDEVHEAPFYDASHYPDRRSSSAFDDGYDLAIEAAGRPIYYYDTENQMMLYFIGTEEEIMTKLEAKIEVWLKSRPPAKTAKDLLQEQLEKAELEAKRAKKALKKLQNQAKKAEK